MLDIDEMSTKEIMDLLHKVGYGHLGFVGEGHPYVVPMHYYLRDSAIQRIPGLCSTVAAVCKPVFKVLNINQIKRSS